MTRYPDLAAVAADGGVGPRKRAVAELLALGQTDEEIASAMSMLPRTVGCFRRDITAMLDPASPTQFHTLAARENDLPVLRGRAR